MNLIQVVILAIVEGVTEFLPVSSTGHLILVSRIMGLVPTEFVTSFEVAIQLGAIAAVGSLYAKTVWNHPNLIPKVLTGFIPAGILGAMFYRFIKLNLLGNTAVTLGALFAGGLVLIFVERRKSRAHIGQVRPTSAIPTIGWTQAIGVGLFQTLAMVPGVSRAGATIVGGLILGLDRKTAVEYSFLLAVPTMVAATTWDLVQNGRLFSLSQWQTLGVGFITAFITAWITVRWFVRYVSSHRLTLFGVYRILLAGSYLSLLLQTAS